MKIVNAHNIDLIKCLIQIQQMYTQKQEQKIKTIDLNEFLDGFHNYRTVINEKDSIKSHPFAMKLRNHLKSRAQTCFSIQTFNPQSRPPSRKNPPSRYQKELPQKQEVPSDLENINLDEFMHVILARQHREENEKAQEFIRSLNGTWFQGTNQHFKCSKIFNTLGIKKSRSMVRPKSERYNPELLRDKIDFMKEFKQTGIFPSRKTNSHIIKKFAKSPNSTPHYASSPSKNNEGSLKYQIVQSIKHELQAKPSSRMSVRPLKSGYATISNTFNNQKISGNTNKNAIVKGTKMLIHL